MKFSAVAKWFNAVANAWNAGEAPWAYDAAGSVAVRVWNERGDAGFVEWATQRGITLRRR